MAQSNHCQEKLAAYKIEGQSKPFVDHNLQLQVPGFDAPDSSIPSLNPIYCHYIHAYPPLYMELPIDINEIEQTIKESEQAYKAWKKMQQQLLSLTKKT